MNKTIRTGPVMSGPGTRVRSNVGTRVIAGSPGGQRPSQSGGAVPIPSLRGRAPGVNMPSLGGPRRGVTGIPISTPAVPIPLIPRRGSARPGRVSSSFIAPGGAKPAASTVGPAGLSAAGAFRPSVGVPSSTRSAAPGSRLGLWSSAGFSGSGAREPIGPSATVSQHRAPAASAMPPGASKIVAPGTPVASPGGGSGTSQTAPKKKQKEKIR